MVSLTPLHIVVFFSFVIELKDLRDLEHLSDISALKTIIHYPLTAAPNFCSRKNYGT